MKRLKNAIMLRLTMLFLVGAVPISIYGQETMAPVTNTYAITNVNVIQAPGRKIESGTVIIKDGLIQAVGKSVTIPADAKIIKADSMYLYAGFIDGLSHVGIEKPKENGRGNRADVKDPGNPPNDLAGIQPERSVRDLLKLDEKSIGEWRKIGFTTAHVVPRGGMLPGSGSIVLLTGNTPDEMIFQTDRTFFSQLEGASGRIYPNTVIGVMAKYRDLYRNAQYAKSYQSKYDQDGVNMERPESDRVLESFYPVIDRRIPVAFRAESVLDVQRVFSLKKELGFDLILGEVKQGWDIAGKIKASGAKVFLSLDLPELEKEKEEAADSVEVEKPEPTEADLEQERLEKRKMEMIMNHYQQPALFTGQEIVFGFSTLQAESKDIKPNLEAMVKHGLSEDAALAALTTSPAQLLGLSKLMGTVDPGKMANLVISDKPYFSEESKVRMVFVDGQLFEYEEEGDKKKANGKEK